MFQLFQLFLMLLFGYLLVFFCLLQAIGFCLDLCTIQYRRIDNFRRGFRFNHFPIRFKAKNKQQNNNNMQRQCQCK